jgi:transcriptional regulator with XRE-family HTH domain
VSSRDIVRIARQRAGITQQQLADRSGHPRETIARWETGAREPSLATLKALVAACDLELVIHLAQKDPSLDELVADQLALTPTERLKRLIPTTALDGTLRALRWLAEARTPVIVIGCCLATDAGAGGAPIARRRAFGPLPAQARRRRAGGFSLSVPEQQPGRPPTQWSQGAPPARRKVSTATTRRW